MSNTWVGQRDTAIFCIYRFRHTSSHVVEMTVGLGVTDHMTNLQVTMVTSVQNLNLKL